MHYKNGRLAKDGDKVVGVINGAPVSGILHSTMGESDTCNGRIAAITPSDPYVNIKDCLHAEDFSATVFVAPSPK